MSYAGAVEVNFTVSRTSATSKGFGNVLVLSPEVSESFEDAELVRTFTSASEALDAYGENSYVYIAAVAAFSQTNKPKRIKVGFVDTVAAIVAVTINSTSNGAHTVAIDGIGSASYTASGDTTTEIAAGLVDAINDAMSTYVTAENTDNVITLTFVIPGVYGTVTATAPAGTAPVVAISTENVSWTSCLNDIANYDSDFFGVTCYSRNEKVIKQVAAWAEQRECMFFYQTSDSRVLAAADTEDPSIGLQLNALSYKNSFGVYANDMTATAEALAFNRLTIDPARAATTFNFVTLTGCPVNTVTETQEGFIEQHYIGYYSDKMAGIKGTYNIVNSVGNVAALMLAGYWAQVRMREGLASALASASNSNSKVSYNEKGGKALSGYALRVLLAGEKVGHFEQGSSTVTCAPEADWTDEQKNNRLFPMTWSTTFTSQGDAIVLTGSLQPTV